MFRVVYDTNVVVSGTLTAGGPPAYLLTLAMTKQRVQLFITPPILKEYSEVLKRPKFAFDHKDIDTFLRDLRRVAIMVHPTHRIEAAHHEPDNRFLECAQTARADYLVTGNKRHFPFPIFDGTKILSPTEFVSIVP
jgi:putative PIN family toxin of toxin-antitoxin system